MSYHITWNNKVLVIKNLMGRDPFVVVKTLLRHLPSEIQFLEVSQFRVRKSCIHFPALCSYFLSPFHFSHVTFCGSPTYQQKPLFPNPAELLPISTFGRLFCYLVFYNCIICQKLSGNFILCKRIVYLGLQPLARPVHYIEYRLRTWKVYNASHNPRIIYTCWFFKLEGALLFKWCIYLCTPAKKATKRSNHKASHAFGPKQGCANCTCECWTVLSGIFIVYPLGGTDT